MNQVSVGWGLEPFGMLKCQLSAVSDGLTLSVVCPRSGGWSFKILTLLLSMFIPMAL